MHHGYNLSCYHSEDGAINLSVTGGAPFHENGTTYYRYRWNTGKEEQNLEKLGPGHYMVRVFDQNEAEVDAQITLTEPDVLDLSFQVSVYQNGFNVSCYKGPSDNE